jgi:hypothetical protein
MTDRRAWTDEDVAAYAALHGLAIQDAAFLSRLRAMAQKAADVAASLPRDAGREDQPAFCFVPGGRMP